MNNEKVDVAYNILRDCGLYVSGIRHNKETGQLEVFKWIDNSVHIVTEITGEEVDAAVARRNKELNREDA